MAVARASIAFLANHSRMAGLSRKAAAEPNSVGIHGPDTFCHCSTPN